MHLMYNHQFVFVPYYLSYLKAAYSKINCCPKSAHLETLHFFGGIDGDGNTSLPAFRHSCIKAKCLDFFNL